MEVNVTMQEPRPGIVGLMVPCSAHIRECRSSTTATHLEPDRHVVALPPNVDRITTNGVVVVVHRTTCTANDRERMLLAE